MINWVDRMIIEYEEGRLALKKQLERLGKSSCSKMDKRQINGMINEMTEVINWLKSGKNPYELRGVDKRSAYQKRVLYDMDLFPSLDIMPEETKEEKELTEDEKRAITDILISLSPRERECYLLHHVNSMSYDGIAHELNVSKASVQTYINRARSKVKEKVLFLEI